MFGISRTDEYKTKRDSILKGRKQHFAVLHQSADGAQSSGMLTEDRKAVRHYKQMLIEFNEGNQATI
jgi:hypothetical protein